MKQIQSETEFACDSWHALVPQLIDWLSDTLHAKTGKDAGLRLHVYLPVLLAEQLKQPAHTSAHRIYQDLLCWLAKLGIPYHLFGARCKTVKVQLFKPKK